MRQIKILHIIGGGEFGGAEQHLLTLLKHLDRQVFEVHVVCLFAEPLAEIMARHDFPVHVVAMKRKLDIMPVFSIAALISREKFDIVHTHGVRANLLGRLAAKKAGVRRVVTTVHSVLAFDYNRSIDRWVNTISEKMTQRITCRFITVCHLLEKHLVAEGIPQDKVRTIHNGIEIEHFNPDLSGEKIRREFNLSSEKIVISVIARFHPVKGHAYLLEAMARIVKENPQVVLFLAGSGSLKNELENLAGVLGIAKNVIFAGFRKDIPEIAAASDFMILPSLSEGLSLTIVEGMAMKKTVISTQVGGTPEIITSGSDGILVPPADVDALREAIEQLLTHPEQRVKLGERARETVEKSFTAQMMADKTAALYQELLGEERL